MKILVLSNYYYPENFSITPLCEYLVRQGHSVTVLTSFPQYGFPKRTTHDPRESVEMIQGVQVIRLKTHSPKGGMIHRLAHYASFYRRATTYLNHHQNQYTVALAMSLSPLMSIAPILKFSRKHRLPVGLYCVDLWPASVEATGLLNRRSVGFQLLNRWSRQIYQGFDQILVGSDAFLPYLKHHHQLTNVFPTVYYQPTFPIPSLSDHLTKSTPIELLYTGHLGKGHPLQRMIEVIETHQLPLLVRVIGHGVTFDAIQQQKVVRTWNFLTLQSSIPSEALGHYFHRADVMVVGLDLPSPVGDTMPHKVLQYMQQGKPVFGLLQGDGANHLHQSKGGWVLPPKATHAEIATVLHSIVKSSKEERLAMGIANQTYYQTNLQQDHVLDLFLSSLTDVKK